MEGTQYGSSIWPFLGVMGPPNATTEEFRDLNLDFDDWKITDDPFSPSTLRDWWKPGELNRAIHLQKYSDDHQDCSDVSWGFEGVSLVVYVSWFTYLDAEKGSGPTTHRL